MIKTVLAIYSALPITNVVVQLVTSADWITVLVSIFILFIYLSYNQIVILEISVGCSPSNPCESNQDCIITKGNGFCVCPRGFKLFSTGECQDIDECLLDPNLCGVNATCHNLIGSYECKCLEFQEGDPYREGCQSIVVQSRGCIDDSDCPLNRKCDIHLGQCYGMINVYYLQMF